eukprot:6474673-Amphidinium_carterae.1
MAMATVNEFTADCNSRAPFLPCNVSTARGLSLSQWAVRRKEKEFDLGLSPARLIPTSKCKIVILDNNLLIHLSQNMTAKNNDLTCPY